MLDSPVSSASLRFGRFELQRAERRLLVAGAPAPLGARAFDLLAALAERPDRLVTKAELMDLVWPGLVVEESNLHAQMSTLRKILGGDVIATVPGRGYRLVSRTEGGAAAAPLPASWPTMDGTLVGRAADVARIDQALAMPGCVTLVGEGGVGKTRVALAVAQQWRGRRFWVDLAPLVDGTQLGGALARACGLQAGDSDAVARAAAVLDADDVLLVIDNAEHLVDACSALAAALLGAAPRLRLLATSQSAVALPGERVLHVEPLAIDGAQDGRGDAIALLVDRIAAADPRVRLDADAVPVLREIGRQCDGLPLALEMAAARVPTLGLRCVRDELVQRFALLARGHRQAAPRHRTLHAALDWSFHLLGPAEQRLLAALGLFADGFTLDLCVALRADETNDRDAASVRWDVIEQLAVLADRSLVAVSQADPPRYRLLETMRAYALEKLAESAEGPALRARHAAVMNAFLAQRTSPDQAPECLREFDNVRAAFEWARGDALALAVDLSVGAARVGTFSVWRGQAHAWMRALEPVMRSAAAEVLPLAQRVTWWNEYARTAIVGLHVYAHEVAVFAQRLARTLGDPLPRFHAAVAVLRSSSTPTPVMAQAEAEVRALVDRLDTQPSLELAWAHACRVRALLALGRLDEARAALPRAFDLCRAFEVAILTTAMVEHTFLRGRPEDAARLVGYADKTFERQGRNTQGVELTATRVQVEAALGAERMRALTAAGRALTDSDALALCLGT